MRVFLQIHLQSRRIFTWAPNVPACERDRIMSMETDNDDLSSF